MPRQSRYDEDAEAWDGPSKTQLKQAMQDLLDLGGELLKLPAAVRDRIPLDPRLREALREHGRMPTREARRRHMQFIGKLLRDTDAEPARRALAELRAGQARVLADAERWRERLLAEDGAFTAWVEAHPATAVQPLRQLIRNARREIAALQAGDPEAAAGQSRAYRDLFQRLRVELERAATAAGRPDAG